jgi:hypothetical protein
MEQTKPTESMSKQTPVAGQRTSGSDPWKVPLSALVDAYPNDFLLRYVIVPTALHIWWSVPLSVVLMNFANCKQDFGRDRRPSFHTLPIVSWVLGH